MFIAHIKGHPVAIKTNRGAHFIAFDVLAEGQTFLQTKQALCSLNTLVEIMQFNPAAFPSEFVVLHLKSQSAIESFSKHPETFPVNEHLVTVKKPESACRGETPAPSQGSRQNEFGF